MNFLPEHIEARLRDEIRDRGMMLLDLKRRGERGTTVIEVVIDSESGITLDDLAEVSRWTSALLDEVEDELPGRYRLEVSSAGLDRPLEYAWQYRKNIGRLAKVTFDDDTGIRKTELFRLIDVTDDALLVGPKVEKKKGTEPRTIPFERITKATIEPEF